MGSHLSRPGAAGAWHDSGERAGIFASFSTSRLVLSAIRQEGATVVIDAVGLDEAAPCPACGTSSHQVHDRYVRRPQDLPWQGRPVRLLVTVRRFCCRTPGCPKRTFAEQFDPACHRTRRYKKRLCLCGGAYPYATASDWSSL